MSVTLSRLAINPRSSAAMRAVATPQACHDLVTQLYGGHRREFCGLFRLDPTNNGPDLLIQAPEPPDWGRLTLPERALRVAPASKPLTLDFACGATLAFRLLARPSVRKSSGSGNRPGPRCDLRTDEERIQWLSRKSERGGFRVLTCGLTLEGYPQIHGERLFTATRFDGELLVTDPADLRALVISGVGPQKAFGFGLLSLAKIH